jgi:uncharacterized membrane protein YebE (DUF533 family)
VKEGATRVGEATGARDALSRATGNADADELLAKLKAVVQNSPFAAGTAAGGLGGLVLGTRAGRAIAANAARIGALAMIGGLAYKAMQNYQAGKPLITGATTTEAAPAGSGFEPDAVTHDAAVHYIQAMVAAATADGRIDDAGDRIIGGLKQAGLDSEAEAFLANELNDPRPVQTWLVPQVTAGGHAIYTAARIAITVDSPAEKQFLKSLAQALEINPTLAAHRRDNPERRCATLRPRCLVSVVNERAPTDCGRPSFITVITLCGLVYLRRACSGPVDA